MDQLDREIRVAWAEMHVWRKEAKRVPDGLTTWCKANANGYRGRLMALLRVRSHLRDLNRVSATIEAHRAIA